MTHIKLLTLFLFSVLVLGRDKSTSRSIFTTISFWYMAGVVTVLFQNQPPAVVLLIYKLKKDNIL